ncbi:PREDICTED: toll-like receptor 13 [Poecilia mexicana]|nr:PREDICTED: toll-like receptor 13 [Poecilia mexicana]
MATRGHLLLFFILEPFCLLHITPSLAYSLKNCTILYQETRSADVSLDCANRNLETIPDDFPKNAASVQLNNNRLKKITRKDFSKMSQLRRLHLGFNQIDSVYDRSFSDLVFLKTLSMEHNNLNHLTRDMFYGLSNLTLLNLSSNFIQFIHCSAFRHMYRLQTLDLGNNDLQQIVEIQPVLQLPQIQTLKLRCNQFSSFETKELSLNFSSLREIDISGRNLERFSITTPIFPFLQMISLSGCEGNSTLKWDITDKTLLKRVVKLYIADAVLSFIETEKVLKSLYSLSHLRLQHLDEWIRKGLLTTVCKLPALKTLDLSNRLTNFILKFQPCSELTQLYLRESYISKLPKGSLQSLEQLQFLNLSTNRLTNVPFDVRHLSSLEILLVGNNLISELNCEDFLNTTRLMELYLNNNRITKLKRCVLQSLTDLKVLGLSNNLILTVGDTFKKTLFKLEVLDMSHNSIISLESGDFQGLQKLKYLNVTRNSIGKVNPEVFQELINLESLTVCLPYDYEPNFTGLQLLEHITLYLYNDGILKTHHSNINESFFTLKSMKTLTMISKDYHYGFPLDMPTELLQSMKHLESFRALNIYINAPPAETFHFNPQLKSLTLAETDLSNLKPGMFLPIPNLQTLDLAKCKIKSLDFLTQANLSALRYLKLSNNEISQINESVYQALPSLTYLDLSNNPFTCECLNADFITWVKSNKETQVINAHQYVCSFPVQKQGTLLLDFDIQSCWDQGNFFFFVSSSSLVVLTLLTSFVYHFLKWHLIYMFHLFLAFLYDSRKGKKADSYQFDAFVSYNSQDEDWVYHEMLPVLEEEQGWRLCLDHRDFQPGKPIIENITDAIYGSRKTICVISRSYLQSEWCSREIQMASFRLFDEKKDVLILLFLEDIPPQHLSPYHRMRKLLKKCTYLSWSKAEKHPGVFWQNVRKALQTKDDPPKDPALLTGPTQC